MSNQHLIALDLDGTLLKDDKTISEKTLTIIEKAKAAGHKVVISTGRPYRASLQYYQQMKLNTAIVNFNGAFVHHPFDRSFQTSHSPLDLKTAQTVIETCEAFKVSNIMVEVIDDFYLRHFDQLLVDTFVAGESPVEYGDLLKILNDDPTCILIHPHEHHITELKGLLKDAHAEVIDQRSWGAPWNVLELVKTGINKAVGLKKVADFYQIPKERIIAFGDEDNDFEMIEYAGQGVAMKNAIPELKSLANEITLTNEEDGIAVYLEEALNLK
ncbi:haloacid dehalogenase [Alkalihalobacillus alcalophilus ATCC 27647 = CGMCC 1.3604]|uniref:Haloacid dehalogenase n=1 Tax=Alkalihalobacillus alcalophilus ATCC 27647 = CGMCC 1.3604 TaxID=1218173 RepID=A0A094YV36_ALKAL|nr:Cof-type HAD-IIB family hydrolase [Alkalihalobacillus alcalophilus]KGA97377.1 phosphatase [Alkalihalobacillus alcalophilus ATCC 27647 = CGMCC 1.3604]MED1561922.1 Cof-type HAD-IIB family hydrolase [Alkalihalobacillus alcalophilus]THG90077.1 haloacid dehalogenase [Alkalihalobacillus alcalophilus ATCC 27647 = CGMCC 1.3604]